MRITDDPLSASERGRFRRGGRWLAGGGLVGLVVAIIAAIAGGTSREGVAWVLLLLSVGAGLGSVDAAVLMLVDQYQGRTSTWRRLALVFGLMLLAILFLTMVSGLTVDDNG